MTDDTRKTKSEQKGGKSIFLVQTSIPHRSRANSLALTTSVDQPISLDELARYTFEYLKLKGIDITQRTQLVHRIGITIDEAKDANASEIPTHGRHFSRIGLDLFVYFDESQESVGRDLFMEESGLFGPLSAWSVSRRMAIFRIDDETSLDRLEKTLTGRGFEKRHASKEALEKGFKTGDTSPLIKRRNDRL